MLVSETVSYTHLDVYKRQERRVVRRRNAIVIGALTPPELVAGVFRRDIDRVRSDFDTVTDPGLHRTMDVMIRHRSAGAGNRCRRAVNLGVVDTVVIGHGFERPGHDATGGRRYTTCLLYTSRCV